MTEALAMALWPSGHRGRPVTDGVCWKRMLHPGWERWIGRGSKLRNAAASTGAGDGARNGSGVNANSPLPSGDMEHSRRRHTGASNAKEARWRTT